MKGDMVKSQYKHCTNSEIFW